MMESQETHARVLSGILSNVKVKNTTADIFFSALVIGKVLQRQVL